MSTDQKREIINKLNDLKFEQTGHYFFSEDYFLRYSGRKLLDALEIAKLPAYRVEGAETVLMFGIYCFTGQALWRDGFRFSILS